MPQRATITEPPIGGTRAQTLLGVNPAQLNRLREVGLLGEEETLREMQTEPVERRIAHALGRLAVQAGRRTPDGIEIDFPITRQDPAEGTLGSDSAEAARR